MENNQGIWTFSQQFSSEFRAARLDIEARLEKAKSSPTAKSIHNITLDVARLAKTLGDATGSLPSYDQKLYESQLSSVENVLNNLRKSTTPKANFTFKRKAALVLPETITSNTGEPAKSNETEQTKTDTSHTSISSHSYSYLGLDTIPGLLSSADVTISNLDHCILNLLPSDDQPQLNISAIHIRNVTDSLLILPIISGSILIHELNHSVLVLGCHQFRMHSSNKVDVYLSIPSNPVIEDCHALRFSEYPRSLLKSGQVERAPTTLAVQDFSHIRNTPSPHWTRLDSTDIPAHWSVHPLMSKTEVESSLHNILPQ